MSTFLQHVTAWVTGIESSWQLTSLHFHRIYHYISANFPVYHFLWHSIWDNCNRLISYHFWYSVSNKCIGDDTKAAASQSANCIKKQNNKIWRKTIFNMADGIITPCNVARSWHWFRQVTAPCNVALPHCRVQSPGEINAHVALESWQRIHQEEAPCIVTRRSGIMTLNSPGGSTLQCSMWLWDTCHGIRPNVRHIEILHLVSSLTISLKSTCHSAPVCEILSKSDDSQQQKNDVKSIFKMADLSHLGY